MSSGGPVAPLHCRATWPTSTPTVCSRCSATRTWRASTSPPRRTSRERRPRARRGSSSGSRRRRPRTRCRSPPPSRSPSRRAALAAGRADLLGALAGHAGKDVAKEAKRGLHLLKSRGVAVPEPPRAAAPAPAAAPEPPLPAYATAIDGQGERAVWLPRSIPGKGIEIAQVVLSDEHGLLELQVGVIGRKEWRAILKGLLEKGAAMGVGEIERGRAVSLVAAARAENDRSGRRVPEGADLWLAQLGPAAPLADPAAAFAPLAEEEEREALAASGALHELPLFSTWLAGGAVPARGRGEARRGRGLAALRRRAAARRAARADGRRRGRPLPRRAAPRRALAPALLGRRAPRRARRRAPRPGAAAAAARALAAGAPPRTVPFARLLVEKAFAGALGAAGAPAGGALRRLAAHRRAAVTRAPAALTGAGTSDTSRPMPSQDRSTAAAPGGGEPGPSPTVDVVISLPDDRVVLVRRRHPPPGWALPGGFVDVGETLEAAAVREAKEETGLDVRLVELLYVYSDPRRDPRRHTVSAVFLGRADGEPVGGDDAAEARAFAWTALPVADRLRSRRDPRGRAPAPPHRGAPQAVTPLSPAERAALLGIARGAVLAHLGVAPPPALPETGALGEPRGAFVTLHVAGDLRGCIGSFRPRGSLAATVAADGRRRRVGGPAVPADRTGRRLGAPRLRLRARAAASARRPSDRRGRAARARREEGLEPRRAPPEGRGRARLGRRRVPAPHLPQGRPAADGLAGARLRGRGLRGGRVRRGVGGVTGILSIVAAVLAVSLLIILHEAGHYFAARAVGMRVERFSVGFGPVLLSFRRGDTLFALSAIPLGGYVSVAGTGSAASADPADPGSYANKSAWRRFVFVLAGPVMNYVTAVLVAWALLASVGLGVADPASRVGALVPGMPAEAAGLRAGDRIEAVGGTPVRDLGGPRPADPAPPRRAGRRSRSSAARGPRRRVRSCGSRRRRRGKVGFGPAELTFRTGPFEAVAGAVRLTNANLAAQLSGFASIFARKQRAELSGPIGIAQELVRGARAGRRALPEARLDDLGRARRPEPPPLPRARRQPAPLPRVRARHAPPRERARRGAHPHRRLRRPPAPHPRGELRRRRPAPPLGARCRSTSSTSRARGTRRGPPGETLAAAPATVGALRARPRGRAPALARVLAALAASRWTRSSPTTTRPLRDGAEVAIVPPVSGGAPLLPGGGPAARARRGRGRGRRRPACGGIVTFTGTVRDETRGRRVLRLEYEAYAPMAERKLAEIGAERGARARRGGRDRPPGGRAPARRRGGGHRLRGAPPHPGVPRLRGLHRGAEAGRADLEARGVRGRVGVGRPRPVTLRRRAPVLSSPPLPGAG